MDGCCHMVQKDILSEIEEAIRTPEAYVVGEAKNRLRAAFDTSVSQAFAEIFGEEPLSRMNARQKLNNANESEHTDVEWERIVALREALRVSEHTLHAKDYSDHGAKIGGFITQQLRRLYDALK